MGKGEHPPRFESFDVTLPDGFELGQHGPALQAAAEDAGWAIERPGAIVAVQDVWTETEDHAAWLVAAKAGRSLSGSPSGRGASDSRGRDACPRP